MLRCTMLCLWLKASIIIVPGWQLFKILFQSILELSFTGAKQVSVSSY